MCMPAFLNKGVVFIQFFNFKTFGRLEVKYHNLV